MEDELEYTEEKDWRELYTTRPEVLRLLLENTGIPKRYQHITLEEHYPDIEWEPEPYYLYGPTGSGKTRLLSALVRAHANSRWHRKRCLFISAVKLLQQLRDSYNRPKRTLDDYDEAEANTDRLITRFSEIDLLALDDLGRARPTGWALETLEMIIDDRYNNMLPTFVSSSTTLGTIAEEFSEQIASRLAQTCKVMEMTGDDRRVKS